MKQQKIVKSSTKKQPIVEDRRTRTNSITMDIVNNSPNVTVRAVVFVEVGDADQIRVQCLLQELNRIYEGSRGGSHYVIPVRNGKLRTDIVFESEFLEIVNKTCEIRDGQIQLKNGATEVNVIRELVK